MQARLLVHTSGVANRWVWPLVGVWIACMAYVCALFGGNRLLGGDDDAPALAVLVSLGMVVAVGLSGMPLIAILRAQMVQKFVRLDGFTLTVLDARGRVVARAQDVRSLQVWRWEIRGRYGASHGLAVLVPGIPKPVSLGARVGEGARMSGREPRGKPCLWLVPREVWDPLQDLLLRAARGARAA